MQRAFRRVSGLPVQLLGFVLAIVLALLVLLAVGGVSVHNQEMRSLIGARDERATRVAATMLSDRFDSRLSLLQNVAAFAPRSSTAQNFLSQFPALNEYFDYGLVLLGSDGNPVWQWQPVTAWASDGVLRSDAPLQHLKSFELLVASSELDNAGNRLLGAFSVESLKVVDLLGGLQSSEFTDVLLVAGDGHVVFASRNHPALQQTDTVPGVELALQGNRGALYTAGPDGKELIVTYSPVGLSGWALVVQEPWEQLAGFTLRLSENSPFVLLTVVIIALLALLFGVLRIVRPLQRLEERASRVAWGDYESISMPVGGIAEIGDLQRALSRMALRVQRAELARQSYIGAMTQGQEEERLRLARELHDDTVQSLIALGQRVQMVERQFKVAPEKAEQKLVELRQLVSETLDNVRRLIRDMRPTYLEDLGLVPALKALCSDVQKSHSFTVTCSVEGPPVRFEQEIDLALYRITQEALSNVARHASASHVNVRLAVGDTSVLTIADNGCGFTVPAQPSDFASSGHFGLMSMTERVRLVGGKLDIDSQPGEGTTISVQFQRVVVD